MRTRAVIYVLIAFLLVALIGLVHRKHTVIGAGNNPYLKLNRYSGETYVLTHDENLNVWYWERVLDSRPE